MFDKEFQPKEPQPLQILIDSFRVSSGSPIAHALFERAYAIDQQLPFDEVPSFFLDIYLSLNEADKKNMHLEMAKLHVQNPNAKAVVKREIDETHSDLSTVIGDQMPRVFDMTDLEHRVKNKEVTLAAFDNALKKAYSLSPQSDRVRNLQAIAGFFNLYSGQKWWHALDEARRTEIKNKGASFFT